MTNITIWRMKMPPQDEVGGIEQNPGETADLLC
jgi:hypothetical protein